ncbi:hypothetical protein D3C71_894460 [compost metagenome]
MPVRVSSLCGLNGEEELLQQGEGLIQGLGFELGALTKPSGIEPVILAAGSAVVIHVFRYRIDQPPSGIAGAGKL